MAKVYKKKRDSFSRPVAFEVGRRSSPRHLQWRRTVALNQAAERLDAFTYPLLARPPAFIPDPLLARPGGLAGLGPPERPGSAPAQSGPPRGSKPHPQAVDARAARKATGSGGTAAAPKVATGPAIWTSQGVDQNVKITGYAGEHGGRHYANRQGGAGALPIDELSWPKATGSGGTAAVRKTSGPAGQLDLLGHKVASLFPGLAPTLSNAMPGRQPGGQGNLFSDPIFRPPPPSPLRDPISHSQALGERQGDLFRKRGPAQVELPLTWKSDPAVTPRKPGFFGLIRQASAASRTRQLDLWPEKKSWLHVDNLGGNVKKVFTSPAAKRLGGHAAVAGAAVVGTAAVVGLGITAWNHPYASGLGMAGIGVAAYGINRGFRSGFFGKAKTWATEKGGGGMDLLKKIQDPTTRADAIFDTAAKGGKTVASGIRGFGGTKAGRFGKWASGPMRRNPRAMMAMLAVGAFTAATVGSGVSGANKAMTMNKMYIQHNQQQRQGILDGATPRDASKQVNPTFSGRRVRGGHMGATGDLVFAMHNKRKG